jgi:hypothetical protein
LTLGDATTELHRKERYFLKKIKELSYGPAIPILGVLPEKSKIGA